jgi:hypothetical protein
VLTALAAGTRPRSVPPLGATPSQPPVFVPSSVRPGTRSSLPPALWSSPAPAIVTVAQPKAPVDYDALFGPESVAPSVPSARPLAAAPLALELDSGSPALELEPETAQAEPLLASQPLTFESSEPEAPTLAAAVSADSAELDAVLGDVPAPTTDAAQAEAPAEAKADDEDGFEMMVEEDDILEIDGDDLEMVEEEET